MGKIFLILSVLIGSSLGSSCFAQDQKAKTPAPKVSTASTAKTKRMEALVATTKPSILNAPIRKPAALDPNSAIEVRGQARTLSMMLVLKNGKDAINFIKVRKDYHAEIMDTSY